jgi:hypothetical protein
MMRYEKRTTVKAIDSRTRHVHWCSLRGVVATGSEIKNWVDYRSCRRPLDRYVGALRYAPDKVRETVLGN